MLCEATIGWEGCDSRRSVKERRFKLAVSAAATAADAAVVDDADGL